MEKRNMWARNILTGAPAGSATVRVRRHATNIDATLFSDNGVTPKANPFTADALTGIFGYYAADGSYDETVTPLPGTGMAYTTADILLGQGFQWFNFVTDFGGVGDDSTDNASAWLACQAALVAAGGGVVYFPPGRYYSSTLTVSATENTCLLGAGRALSTLVSDAAGVMNVTGRFVTLQNIGVAMEGAATYGVKFDNGTTVPQTGADAPCLVNVKIRGAAGSGHGLWLVNCLHGYFQQLYLPRGGGQAIRFEASGFHYFGGTWITTNLLDPGSHKWTHGITLQKQAGNLIFQSDDNKFYQTVIEDVGTGILITSQLPTTQAPARNAFHGGTVEGNSVANIVLENSQNNSFYDMHAETAPKGFWIVGNVGNHVNNIVNCLGQCDIDNPAGAQGIQANSIENHVGDVTIGGGNVFGTDVDGVTGTFTDGGAATTAKIATLALAPNAVAYHYFGGHKIYPPAATLQAIQVSGGVFANICALELGTSGYVIINSKQDATNKLAAYQVGYSYGAAGGSVTAITLSTFGADTAQMTFQFSGGFLQGRGVNAATPPDAVLATIHSWPAG